MKLTGGDNYHQISPDSSFSSFSFSEFPFDSFIYSTRSKRTWEFHLNNEKPRVYARETVNISLKEDFLTGNACRITVLFSCTHVQA